MTETQRTWRIGAFLQTSLPGDLSPQAVSRLPESEREREFATARSVCLSAVRAARHFPTIHPEALRYSGECESLLGLKQKAESTWKAAAAEAVSLGPIYDQAMIELTMGRLAKNESATEKGAGNDSNDSKKRFRRSLRNLMDRANSSENRLEALVLEILTGLSHLRLHVGSFGKSPFLLPVFLVVFLAHASHSVLAGAFLNQTQSAGASSVSTAGETAIAEDATTVYYNAAGMALLQRPEISSTTPIIFLSSQFQNMGTTAGMGDAAHGSNGNKKQSFTIPSVFATLPLSDRITVGLGLFIPFGQANTYPDDWVGRYQLQKTSLKTIDIDPAVAYRLTDSLSVGGGIDVQYAHIVRNNALDLGALCVVTVGPTPCAGLGLGPQSADGRQLVTAANWGLGFNVGLLYVLDDATHVGLNYRSAIRHDLAGTAIFQIPAIAAPLTAGSLFQNTGVRSSLTFPDVIALGVSRKLNDRLTILADFDWTGWHRLSQLNVDFANPAQPDETLPLHWKNSIRFAVGGIYNVTDGIGLRAGVSYDETPTSITFRSADLPDSNEIMGSAGLSFRFNEHLSTIVSYSYGHSAAAPVYLSLPNSGTLAGTFKRSANSLALQGLIQF